MRTFFLPMFMILFTPLLLAAQQFNVTGRVLDETEAPLPGVSIVITGTSQGTITDIEGMFNILCSIGNSLEFSFIGYHKKQISVDGAGPLRIIMTPESKQMEEVVVTALGIKREKKALGYSVQDINGDALRSAKDISIMNQLSGRVAGLKVSGTTGGPGSSSRLVLRGITSLKGDNQPLIVLDGVPIENQTLNTTSEWGGRDYGSGLGEINPEDIESVSVLKGASASSLYGSRGGNGVIVITTKKGAKHAKDGFKSFGVSVNSHTSFEVPYILMKFQDSYGGGRNGLFEDPWDMQTGIPTFTTVSRNSFGSWGPKMEGQQIVDWDGETSKFEPQPNNYRDYFQIGSTQTNSVAIEGGGENGSARLSYTNLKNSDISPNSSYLRHTLNFNTSIKINERIAVNGTISYIYNKANNRAALSNSMSASRNIIMMPRHISDASLRNHLMDKDGKEMVWFTNWGWMTNPYWESKYNLNEDTKKRIIGSLSVNYNITPELSILIRGSSDSHTFKAESRTVTNTFYSPNGAFNTERGTFSETNYDFLLSYSKKYNDFEYSVCFGGNRYENNSETLILNTTNGLAIPYFYSINNSRDNPFVRRNPNRKRINSLYGFVRASYKNYLFLDVTGRNDWSSSLLIKNCSYFYPSVSLGFVFTDALKMESEILNFGKLRLSYAQAGKDTDPYKLEPEYPLTEYPFGELPMAYIDPTARNRNIKPEMKYAYEGGFAFRLLNNRVGIDASFYQEKVKNQIVDAGIPNSSGFQWATLNIGEIRSKGFELELNVSPVKNSVFKWDVAFNYARNKSIVKKLAEGVEMVTLANQWRIGVVAVEGHEYGDIYGYAIKRDSSGNPLVNENTGLYIRDEKQKVLGNYQPKWTGGLNNSFSYKNLSFSFLIDFHMGGEMYSGSNMYADGYSGNLPITLEGREEWYKSEQERITAGVAPANWVATGGYLADGVYENGQPNSIYVNPQDYWSQFSNWTTEMYDPFIYDASYVKLKELVLTYTLPSKFTKKVNIENVSFSLTGKNLWLIYSGVPNIDPEYASYSNGNAQGIELYAYPSCRSYGFNLKFNF